MIEYANFLGGAAVLVILNRNSGNWMIKVDKADANGRDIPFQIRVYRFVRLSPKRRNVWGALERGIGTLLMLTRT